MMSVQVSYKKHFLLSIFLILIILGVAEGFSRVYEFIVPHCGFLKSDAMKNVDYFLKVAICYEHDALEWFEDVIQKYNPNQHFQTININSYGFRGPEITKEKGDDIYRIFMVGGSTTFGSGASSDETTIPGFLQKKFDNIQLDTKIEVINGGIRGTGSAQEKFYIETVLLDFDPDLFIIYDGANEIGSGILLEIYDDDGNLLGFKEVDASVDKKIDNPFKFKNFPQYRTPFVVKQIFFDKDSNLPATELSEESILLFKQRWTEVCELGNRMGFSMIITVQPVLGSSTKSLSPSETIRAKEKAFLSGRLQTLDGMVESLSELDKYCTKTFDLTNVFDNVTEPVYLDGAHLYDFGNEIVAQEIFVKVSPIVLDEIQIMERQ